MEYERFYLIQGTMNNKCENFKIMVGGQVVGTARSGILTYLDTVEKAEEPKHDESHKSWDISCNALVKGGDVLDALKDTMKGPQLVNMQITRPTGKMPRKMKKADKLDPYGKTKWGRKTINYRRRRTTILNDAEIVITKQDQETLTATITKQLTNTNRTNNHEFKEL